MRTSSLIKKASDFAIEHHKQQRRKNGDPYYYHPLAVANSLAEWELDETTIAAGFLHALYETGTITRDVILAQFGEDVVRLLDGVRDIRKITYSGAGKDIETFRKFILQVGKDVRAMLIQLASRLDNLKLLYIQDTNAQRHIAHETLEIHAPLAYRLGMYKLGGELEDLAFPYLYPKEYKWILKNLKDLYETRERYVERLKGLVEASLKAHGLQPVEMHSRAKRYASLYKKLLKYDMKLDSIYDLVALRVVVNTIEECYRALEIINRYWPPHPEGFDDYIEHPKPNGYRSLHANIYGPEKKITEIQIRTKEMHYEAELGIAAKFAYDRMKDTPEYARGGVSMSGKHDSWIRRLVQWRANPKKGLAIDIFQNTILVISPKQELVELPTGSTALDYAFKIHSRLGLRAKSARINGIPKPINTKLVFGDVVEIIEDAGISPTADWLHDVTTSNAKSHIKAALSAAGVPPAKNEVAVKPSSVPQILRLSHTGQVSILPEVLKLLHQLNILVHKTTIHTTGVLAKSPTISLSVSNVQNEKETLEKLTCLAGITKAILQPDRKST